MSTNHTPNYALSQWERTDKVLMDDFNADNAKIDAALGEHTAALAAQAAQITRRGNCMFYHGTYRGTGGTVGVGHPTSFSFPWKPELAVIVGYNSLVVMPYGATNPINYYGVLAVDLTVSWSGNTVSWNLIEGTTDNAYLQMNQQNTTYHVFAFAALS